MNPNRARPVASLASYLYNIPFDSQASWKSTDLARCIRLSTQRLRHFEKALQHDPNCHRSLGEAKSSPPALERPI